jgi:hypothetical protein
VTGVGGENHARECRVVDLLIFMHQGKAGEATCGEVGIGSQCQTCGPRDPLANIIVGVDSVRRWQLLSFDNVKKISWML